MATSTIKLPYQLQRSGIFFRSNNVAGIITATWITTTNRVVPEGWRPLVMAGFSAPLRSGAGATPIIGQLRVNADGTLVIMDSGMTEFYGTFVWPVS